MTVRMSRVAPSPTLRVSAEADRLRRQGVDVVDLGAGEPDFPTPAHIKAAACAAIDSDFTKYTPSCGVMELREAICARYEADYGVRFRPEQTIVTAGAKQALFNTALALFEEGDEVITHAPYWPTIPEQVKLAGATPVIVRTHADDGFEIHAEPMVAAITARTKGIIINSPCNPTGALMSEAAMHTIVDAAAARGIWVIADVTYEKLIYDADAHNLVRILTERHGDRFVICSAASKAYAMTGWRCGWAIGPASCIAALNAIQGHSTSNVTSITQKAALAALAGPQDSVAMMLNEYRTRRDRVWEWLMADRRFSCLKPRGAFYLFPFAVDALEATGIRTTAEFAEALLSDVHVAVTAGEGFDAPGFFRISYATSLDRLREGVTRIHEFVDRRTRAVSPQRAGSGESRAFGVAAE
jgi:aspartate aminotransferase